MKKFTIVTAALLAVGISFGTVAAQTPEAAPANPQIGLIDMAYVFKNYDKLKDASGGLEASAKEVQGKLQQMMEQGKSLNAQLTNFEPGSADHSRIENEMIELQTKVKTFQQVEQREIVRKQAELYKEVYLEVQSLVERYATHYNYTLVMRFDRNEVAQTTNPQAIVQGMTRQVVYYQKRDDITEPVLKFLNSEYKKTAAN